MGCGTFILIIVAALVAAFVAGIVKAANPKDGDIKGAIAAVLAFVCVFIFAEFACSSKSTPAPNLPQAASRESEPPSEPTESVKRLQLKKGTIRVGMTFDDALLILGSGNKNMTSQSKIEIPNSSDFIVQKSYEMDGLKFHINIGRSTDPGPHLIQSIFLHPKLKKADASAKKLEGEGVTTPRLTTKQILEARSKYKVEVISFDVSKSVRSDFPGSDLVRIRVTNGSKVQLPLLTVRINRYCKGELAGWSRAPAIVVSDLQPGQSKEVDFYPIGHFTVVDVDRITIQIEKSISGEDRQFFRELD